MILDGTVVRRGGNDRGGWDGVAVYSRCDRFRYYLERTFRQPAIDELPGLALFALLNPSTASEAKPDPTSSRCSSIARLLGRRRWGVVNVAARRGPKPAEVAKILRAGGDVDGELNAETHRLALVDVVTSGGVVVCGWGDHAWAAPLARRFTRLALELVGPDRLRMVRLTENGTPGHPLYTPRETWATSPWSDAETYAKDAA